MIVISTDTDVVLEGGQSIAPKTISANAESASL